MASATVACSLRFVGAVCSALGARHRVLPLPVSGSGEPRTMYSLAEAAPFLTRQVSLGPFSLPASPGWEGRLGPETVAGVLRRLQGPGTRGFTWHVRFDHGPLARLLEASGLPSRRNSTRVLPVDLGYERAASAFSATIRNQVRKAERRGVRVRIGAGAEDVRAYHRLHEELVASREWRGHRYPLPLLMELAAMTEAVRLLVAEWEGNVIAGKLFLRDPDTVFYWQGAVDPRFHHLHASRAILDEAVRWAADAGAAALDLGGSAGIASLAAYKEAWGATRADNWSFQWHNPLWQRLSALKGAVAGGQG